MRKPEIKNCIFLSLSLVGSASAVFGWKNFENYLFKDRQTVLNRNSVTMAKKKQLFLNYNLTQQVFFFVWPKYLKTRDSLLADDTL